MKPRSLPMVVWLVSSLLLPGLGHADASQAKERTTRVAIVERDPMPPGYRIVIEGRRSRGGDMLDGLAEGYVDGDQLALLFDADVPLEAIATLMSLASKVGYYGERLKLFVLDGRRRSMGELSLDGDWIAFSSDPATMAARFSSK